MGITHAYAGDIVKAERDEHGDLIVHGKATGPDLDLDGQICDPAWLKKAMPEWFEWANVREMHQPIAAGVGVEMAAEGDDFLLVSKCIDEGTAKKLEAGVLRGYSIGIKNAKVVKDASAPGGRIVGGDIVEVSYVDRPCNPTATLAIAKAADGELAPVEAEPAEDGDEDEGTGDGDAPKAIAMTEAELHAFILKTVRPVETTDDDRERAIALIKAVGPNGEIDEAPDIAGGRQAIALIARLIKAEADELAAGELDESCDISLLVSAVECLKMWLAREQSADSGADGGEGVTYVALAAQLGYTPAEADALAPEVKAALAELAKRDFSAKERQQAADEGQAMPDGSFPIKTVQDLKNAIRAVGRAKDPAAAKAHIKRRARALGESDLIPDDWKDVDADVTKTTGTDTVSKDEIADLVKGAVTEATKAAQERIDALAAELAKVKATPLPGGPVVTATATRQQASGPDLDKAAYYEAMAGQVQDPAAATGYRQKAAELRRAAGQSH